MKKTRLNRKGKQVVTAFFIILIIILMLLIFVGIKLYERYSPTKERMNYQDYFEMQDENQVMVYMNDEQLDIKVLVEEGRCYLPREYVVDNLNCRFYKDIEGNYIMYTVADNIYSFATDEAYYTDMNGNTVPTDYVVVKSEGDELYVAIDYVKEHSDFEYRFYENPYRLLMWDEYTEKTYALLNKDTAIRFRGGIKSPIIADGLKDQEVEVLQDLEDWIEVRTEDGYMGYVSAKRVGETYTRTMESTYVEEPAPASISLDYKINLVFQSIGTAAYDGERVEEALKSTQGVNVISPTWYKLSGNDGSMTCYANKSYVEKCHSMGIQVWALVDDFDTSLDKLAILSNKDTRARMINRLVSDAREYGFDGINLDFEYITEETIEHYLQFIRELSFECEKNGIILSTDTYVPASFNLFYNRKEQGVWIDYAIVMGYDEYWKGASEAGPVASISHVRNGVVNTLEEIPAQKVINGMPYYVRVWYETLNTDGTVSLTTKDVGMEAAQKIINDNSVPLMWDDEKKLYYGSYENGNVTVKLWLENEDTIEEKMKVYKENNLAGVAGWKLGLEKKEVWQVIEAYLN
ncbi:MAG: glycosyl hydrolase family 18 protein [Thermoflexaceae bacterium]|nr:glycosyl hydrolase family 18 protein [Thermoflexaceae bacterium]